MTAKERREATDLAAKSYCEGVIKMSLDRGQLRTALELVAFDAINQAFRELKYDHHWTQRLTIAGVQKIRTAFAECLQVMVEEISERIEDGK